MTQEFEIQHRQVKNFDWVRHVFHRLSIRQKIVFGYAFALGIAIFGTTGGLIVGNHYFQQAQLMMETADEEGSLLSTFQGLLLEIQNHQRGIVNFVQEPQVLEEHMTHMVTHSMETEALLNELRQFSTAKSQKDLQQLLERYDGVIKIYIKQTRIQTQQLAEFSRQPQGIQKAQQLILSFEQTPSILKFYEFSHDLNKFAKTVRERQKQADVSFNQARYLVSIIIIASIALSTIASILIAMYTSRLILQPLRAVTNVANKVIQEADFNQQVPIMSSDEVGMLANSFNQLIQQVKQLLEQQQAEAQAQLIQNEKMSGLGQMIAGVAHEINNPVTYISGNLDHAIAYINDLFRLLKAYEEELPNPSMVIQQIAKEIDIEFIEADLPKLLRSIEFGANRTREIALSVKDFSRFDDGEFESVDVQGCIDNTLNILHNRFKTSINIIRNYDDVPKVTGYTGLLYQVFMNLLSNAIDAIEEKIANNYNFKPTITITTQYTLSSVIIKIADNGAGIAPENQQKIFDNFFTTKPRGVGTGLGLAISYQIITEKHSGEISFESQLGEGTEFLIRLPTDVY